METVQQKVARLKAIDELLIGVDPSRPRMESGIETIRDDLRRLMQPAIDDAIEHEERMVFCEKAREGTHGREPEPDWDDPNSPWHWSAFRDGVDPAIAKAKAQEEMPDRADWIAGLPPEIHAAIKKAEEDRERIDF